MERGYRMVLTAVLVLAVTLGMAGCAGFKKQAGGSPPDAETEKAEGPVPLYYDFGDVLIPSELKLDKNTSFVFKTPGMSAGVLALSGRVEINSLITFFETNMAKDNWQQVASFKSSRTIMLFQKENRWCVINITDRDFSTAVEIWVAPTTADASPGLLR
jgi:hypothetical protein